MGKLATLVVVEVKASQVTLVTCSHHHSDEAECVRVLMSPSQRWHVPEFLSMKLAQALSIPFCSVRYLKTQELGGRDHPCLTLGSQGGGHKEVKDQAEVKMELGVGDLGAVAESLASTWGVTPFTDSASFCPPQFLRY